MLIHSYGETWYEYNKTDHQPRNTGQTPVLTVDQPLYAIAKKIQWTCPEEYGDRQFVVMMGGLHIEMVMLNVIGDFLEGNGLVHVMTSENVTTEGRAFGLQKSSHTSRAQWAHQVTVAALFVILRRSYDAYPIMTPDSENKWILMCGAKIWRQIIRSCITGIRSCSWNCCSCSFLDHSKKGSLRCTLTHLERSFHGCSPLISTTMQDG